MRFALLGDHPDGLALAQAMVDSGRHQLIAVSGVLDADRLTHLGQPRRVSDVEEILADPAVEAVIVAGSMSVRELQLRRALQSERDVLCVHPADAKPDLAYEAAMIQADVKRRLAPLLPDALHPAVGRLGELIDRDGGRSPVGVFRLLTVERHEAGEAAAPWDVLRRLGGELGEVSAFAEGEALEDGRAVLVAGRFEMGGLFQAALLPGRPSSRWRLTVTGATGEATLTFPQGRGGPAFLDVGGAEEAWPAWDPWPAVLEAFESGALSWQDEVRMLELDDAARRGVEKRRAQAMEYQEANEEVGFKGAMAMSGCALLWGVLLLLIVSVWVPWAGWVILPLLVGFIALQLLRYVIPAREKRGP
jgi:hypothetical protein